VYMWYCYQPVFSNGDCKVNREVLLDENLIPFTVCSSPFYDESSELADMILPDATYIERWDWEDHASPDQIPEFYVRQPLVEPLGEVRDLSDVFCDLADRMGMPLGFSSKEEFVQMSCDMTPEIKAIGGFDYMRTNGVWHDPKAKPKFYSYLKKVSDAKFKAEGVIFDEATGVYWNWKKSSAKSAEEAGQKGYTATKNAYKGYVGQLIGGTVYTGFPPDKVNKSGYFELYSELMEAKGEAPLPTYEPIPEHARKRENELILTTYKVNAQVHSRTQNCKWLSEIYHDNPAWINPETAAQQGIADGDTIKVVSDIGEIETRVRVTPAVVPGTIAISFHCGHWAYGRYASGKKTPFGGPAEDDKWIWWKNHGENPNWIIPNSPDPISGQLRFMDTVVSVQKVA
ncbi:MAG: molybdopterin dinucleotide binding domain-containing protein, partial [Alphaproteobacteria bacterium]